MFAGVAVQVGFLLRARPLTGLFWMKNGGLAVKMVIDARAQNLLLPMSD